MREERLGGPQVWRLEPFGEPAIHIFETTPRLGLTMMGAPQARQAHRRAEF